MIKKEDRRIKYDREHTVMITLKLNRKTDADIIQFLEGNTSGNRSAFLKNMIRTYMLHFTIVSNTDA